MKKALILTLSLSFALGVAACGKKGDLQPPAGYEAPAE